MTAFTRAVLGSIAASLFIVDGAAYAQDVRLEEIIVTARKRQESLFDVPVAISAFTAGDIEAANITEFSQLRQFTPGFFVADATTLRADRASRNFIVRGMNVGGASFTASAAVLFIDGAPAASGDIGSFVDVERVEVLRGPQAAYFGRSTFTGAINVITKTPGNEWKGRVSAEAARFNTTSVDVSVEGPILEDKLSVRLSGLQSNKGGHYKNQANTSERLGDRDTQSFNISAFAQPTDELSVRLYASRFKFDDGHDARALFTLDQMNCDAGLGGGRPNWICGEIPQFPNRLLGFNTVVDQRFRDLVFRESLYAPNPKTDHAGLVKIEYDVHGIVSYNTPGGWSLEAITAHHKEESTLISDEDGRDTSNLPNPNFGRPGFNVRPTFNELVLIDRYAKDYSQDFKVNSPDSNRFRMTAGANYIYVNAILSWVTGDQLGGVRSPATSTGRSIVNTYGVFGGTYYDIAENLTVGAEARYQWDKVKSVSLPVSNVVLQRTFQSFSPRLTVEYKPQPELTLFALAARGYRPGTFNTQLVSLSPSQVQQLQNLTGAKLEVDEEHLDDYEIGAKYQFWDGRAQAQLTLYTGALNDQQVTTTGIVFDDRGIATSRTATSNIGKTNMKGVEFEGAAQFTDQLNMTASFAMNDTEIKEYFCQTCLATITGSGNVIGNRLPGAPKWTASATATYRDRLTGDYDWFARAEYAYEGKKYAFDENLAHTGDRQIVNVRAGIESDAVRFEGYVTNLFNDKSYKQAIRGTDRINGFRTTIIAELADRPVWGVRAAYDF